MNGDKKGKISPAASISPSETIFNICNFLKENKGKWVAKSDLRKELGLSEKVITYNLRGMKNLQERLGDKTPWDEIEFKHRHVCMKGDPDKDIRIHDVRILLDGIRANRNISNVEKDALSKKLVALLTSKERESVDSTISDFQTIYEIKKIKWFETIEKLQKAIAEKKPIEMTYGRIGCEKEICDEKKYTVLPFQIVFVDGYYLLLTRVKEERRTQETSLDDEKIKIDYPVKVFRVDKIISIFELPDQKKDFSAAGRHPFSKEDCGGLTVEGQSDSPFDTTLRVVLMVKKSEIERVFETFGTQNVRVSQSRQEEDRVETTVSAGERDMVRFLCANADIAEVIEPQRVRNAMLKISENLYKKYMATEQDRVEKAYQEALVSRHGGALRTSDVKLRERFKKERRQDKIGKLIVDRMSDAIRLDIKSYCNLYELCFEDIEDVDLSVLEYYPNLRRLRVEHGFSFSKEKPVHVFNTDSLQKCSHLEIVTFSKTDFSDVNALRGLKELRSLYLTNGCNFETLDFIADLPALIDLHLQGSSVEDISALEHHKELFILGADQNFMERFGKKIEEIAPHLRIKISARRKSPSTPRPQGPSTTNDVNHSIKRRT